MALQVNIMSGEFRSVEIQASPQLAAHQRPVRCHNGVGRKIAEELHRLANAERREQAREPLTNLVIDNREAILGNNKARGGCRAVLRQQHIANAKQHGGVSREEAASVEARRLGNKAVEAYTAVRWPQAVEFTE